MNQSLTIILYLIFSGTALFGETPGKLAATTQDPGPQSGKPSGNPTDQPSERSAEELLGKAAEAVKAVQTRVKEDRILGPLSTAKPRADGPKLVELSTTTPESWADFPTKSGGTTRGHGRLRISVFANLPGELPCTPFMPPKGCYWGSTYLLVPGTSAKVLIETVTSDPEAQRRLVKVVVQELAKVSITAHAKDGAKLDSVPQPESVLRQAEKALRSALCDLGEEVRFEYAEHSTSLTVKYQSRKFTVHGGSKTGAFSEDAHETEGPSVKGFLLRIHAQDEGTVNQAVVPQTIRQPYWRTDLDITVVPDTGHQLYWALAHGSRTEESLLNRVRAAVKGLGTPVEVKLPPPEPTKRKPDHLNLTLGWIADSDKQGEREYLFVLNGIVAYRTVEGLRNHVKGLPKGSTIRWAPGCCRMGDEPLLSSPDELDRFKGFCASCGVTLEIIPSG